MASTGPRKTKEPELWGAAEASECFGVTQGNLRTVHGLPEPYAKIRATTLYRADEVRQAAIARNERNSRRAAKVA